MFDRLSRIVASNEARARLLMFFWLVSLVVMLIGFGVIAGPWLDHVSVGVVEIRDERREARAHPRRRRSAVDRRDAAEFPALDVDGAVAEPEVVKLPLLLLEGVAHERDRKSTRLNSSHGS